MSFSFLFSKQNQTHQPHPISKKKICHLEQQFEIIIRNPPLFRVNNLMSIPVSFHLRLNIMLSSPVSLKSWYHPGWYKARKKI